MPDPATTETDPAEERTRLLAAYDAQLRGAAEVDTAPVWDHVGPLWRAEHGDRGFVSYESLAGYDVPALVRATREHFAERQHITSVEWKTRGHDAVDGLEATLREHGFEPEELETVMVGEAERLTHAPEPGGALRVVRLLERDELAEAAALQTEVFGHTFDLTEVALSRPDTCEIWGVRDDAHPGASGEPGRLVCAGRLEKVPGSDFAGLWGGGTLPAYRGRGVYRALTAARARSALAAGHRLLQSDCTEMSRPILERSGLVAVTTTTPYVWTRR